MSGTSAARQFTEGDKARILATLAANNGNVKQTARECSVAPASIRRWRDAQARGVRVVSSAAKAKAVGEFTDRAEGIRNKAMDLLEERIDEGDIKSSELITTIGILDDKLVRAKGQPTSRIDTGSGLPAPEQLRELMSGIVQGAIAAAERRHEEIIEAEVVEVAGEIPASTT